MFVKFTRLISNVNISSLLYRTDISEIDESETDLLFWRRFVVNDLAELNLFDRSKLSFRRMLVLSRVDMGCLKPLISAQSPFSSVLQSSASTPSNSVFPFSLSSASPRNILLQKSEGSIRIVRLCSTPGGNSI